MIWGDSFGYGDRGSRILYLSFSLLDALIIFLYYVFQSLYLSIQYLHLCAASFHISQLLLFHSQFTLFILDFLLQSSYLSLISFIQFNSLSIIRISFVTWLGLLMTQSFIQLQGDMLTLLWITATAHVLSIKIQILSYQLQALQQIISSVMMITIKCINCIKINLDQTCQMQFNSTILIKQRSYDPSVLSFRKDRLQQAIGNRQDLSKQSHCDFIVQIWMTNMNNVVDDQEFCILALALLIFQYPSLICFFRVYICLFIFYSYNWFIVVLISDILLNLSYFIANSLFLFQTDCSKTAICFSYL